ncbi:MAG: hypothetical protein AB7S26_24895 [Sandaracinaceae bacterium]
MADPRAALEAELSPFLHPLAVARRIAEPLPFLAALPTFSAELMPGCYH